MRCNDGTMMGKCDGRLATTDARITAVRELTTQKNSGLTASTWHGCKSSQQNDEDIEHTECSVATENKTESVTQRRSTQERGVRHRHAVNDSGNDISGGCPCLIMDW